MKVIQETMGPHVRLINSGAIAAAQIDPGLVTGSDDRHDHLFMVSDLPARFRNVGERFLGRELPSLHQVIYKESWVVSR
jgi:glutamate racemase